MEFDKSKVYTAINADELKIGSKVIFADNLTSLKNYVENESYIEMLAHVATEDKNCRFSNDDLTYYALAYLVELPKKLKWTDLKVGDVIKRDGRTSMVICTDTDDDKSFCHICAGHGWISDEELEKWNKVEL
ncbi:MAG: hypothetical protein J6P07_00270 [Spirochaetaceae bacterium]|nr:hypothetical protein [Spirochaetaceae bacterium]MBO7731948.1 hypothetical protein [Methanobrevibacter sp.]